MKKILSVLLTMLVSVSLFAAETFTCDSYDVTIDLAQDGRHRVSESLELDFFQPSHGIYRDIKYVFSNPGRFDVKAKVENIESNMEMKTEKEDGWCHIRLGSPDRYLEGKTDIDIAYDFVMRFDLYDEYDEFYYNIVSPAWDTVMDTVNFTIRFPSPVNEDYIWLTRGWPEDSREIDSWSLSLDGMTLTGTVHNMMPYEALTVRAEMAEGYFSFPEKPSLGLPFSIVFLVLCAAFIAFAVWSWWRWGNDDELIVPVRFTPPEGMSPLDCGYVIDGVVDFETDVLPMIFYWADKGLMTIEDTGDGDFIFAKRRDSYEGMTKYESDLFRLFFASGDLITTKDVVESKFLEKSARATEAIKHHYAQNSPLKDKKAEKHKNMVKLLGVLEILLFGFLVSIDHLSVSMFLLVPSVMMFAMNSAFSYAYFKKWSMRTRGKNILYVTLAMIPNVIATGLLGAFLIMYDYPTALIVLLAIMHNLAIVTSSFVADASDKRSEFGTKLLTGVLGYREFLDKVEVGKLEALVEEDPEYFYHNLAYAACFGLTEKYVRKFQNISYRQPDWLMGSAVDYWYWNALSSGWRKQYMSQFASANASASGSSTVSGSSGFAGGGFSGGGGRSW